MMNELINEAFTAPIWTKAFAAVVIFGLAPYPVLRLSLLFWPKGHDRHEEYLGEFEHVSYAKRPIWVADVAARSVIDGTTIRARAIKTRMSEFNWHGSTRSSSRTARTVAIGAAAVGVSVGLPALAIDRSGGGTVQTSESGSGGDIILLVVAGAAIGVSLLLAIASVAWSARARRARRAATRTDA
jgi:hypothetical protein